MKKLMLSLAVACASAIAAFADGPTWFAEAVSVSPSSGDWKVGTQAADLSALMGGTGYITYKDMENDLVFTATSKPELPGDEATVNTTVKFTAMAMEDFTELTNANESAWADAKGGLTIIEDPENTYKFYGIVNGTWQELADGTVTAASIINGNAAVPVEVKIWENNGRKISYKVNSAFIGNSEAGLAAAIADDKLTISSIAYRGNCEIKSLTGDRANEMWEVTLTHLLADANAKLKIGDDEPVIYEGATSIRGTTQKVQVVYSAPVGMMFFPTTGGEGTNADQTKDLDVIGTKEYDAALTTSMECATVVAKIDIGTDDEKSYKSLADAISAGADKTVKVVATPEQNDQEVSHSMSLNADGFTVEGNIVIAKGAVLTVLGGTFTGAFSVTDDGSILDGLILAGESKFNQIAQANAQQIVATKYFAKVYNETGSEIIEGTAPTQNIPVAYDPAIIPQGSDPEKYLTADAANGQKRWVNYALGLDPETAVAPNFNKDGATDAAISIGSNTPGNPGTGYEVFYTIGDSEELTDGVIKLKDIVDAKDHKITLQMKIINRDADEAEATVVTQKVIGAQKPTVSTAEAADVKLITVPYKQIDGSAMNIDEVINKANLVVGDKLSIYNNGDYDHYTLDKNGAWVMDDKAGANSVPTVKPGQGIWLKTKAENFFQYGLVDDSAVTVTLNAGWNLIGIQGESLALDAINEAEAGDMIRVEDVETQLPVEYTYDGTKWTYNAVETSEFELPNGRKVPKKTVTETTVSESIPVNSGSGVWYVSESGKASIEL